ncbi:MAG TPA: hypothetical protein VF657_03570 [Actinoplanes sp.]|jgi:hypothetical protein
MTDTRRDEIHQLDELYRSLDDVRSRLTRLVDTDLLAELLPIWKRPGWTTPAEFLLVRGMLAGIQHQVEGLEQSIEVLVKGADVVAPR